MMIYRSNGQNSIRLYARMVFRRWLSVPLVLLIGVWGLNLYYPLNLPSNNKLFARIVVDSDGNPLRAFADEHGIWRYPISIDDVSPRYIDALLTYEDRWFWIHPGFNPAALVRAALLNIRHGRIISGGSTISMQVARLLHPHSRTIAGKLKQLLRTLQLESQLSKKEILTLYLNIAPFGGTIEGVQAASFTYLNKSARHLSYAEAALLAVLPQSPTRFRPDLHPQVAQQARNKVLHRMATLGKWSNDIIEQAKIESVTGFYRKHQLSAPLLAQRLLANGDGQQAIKTTINGPLQQSLEDYLHHYIHRLPERSSAAILVVDNATAAVKAYLGTANFADKNRFGHVDMVRATRSPGSTLKPFLYGMAIDEGLIHSHSLLADVPRTWGQYRPGNFSEGFSGPVSAAQALQRSLNAPAVDLLARFSPHRFVNQLAGAGLNLIIPDNEPNLSVILGGGGTSLEQLVTTYMALARRGKTTRLRYRQEELSHPLYERYLLSPESAWIIHRILTDIPRPGSLHTRAPLQSTLNNNNSLAWKTGTSYGFRDSWAIGVNARYTIGIWVGRPDGTPIPGHNGRMSAGPLLFAVADHLQSDTATAPPIIKPDTVKQAAICWPLGTLAHQQPAHHCQQQHQAWVIDGQIPPTWHAVESDNWQAPVIQYWINPASGLQVNAQCTAIEKQVKTIATWPTVLEPWLPRYLRRQQQLPKIDTSCSNTVVNITSSPLKITSIMANSVYRPASSSQRRPSVHLRAIGGSGQQHWYINGKRLYSHRGPGSIVHTLQEKGKNQIVVIDDSGNIDKVVVTVL